MDVFSVDSMEQPGYSFELIRISLDGSFHREQAFAHRRLYWSIVQMDLPECRIHFTSYTERASAGDGTETGNGQFY